MTFVPFNRAALAGPEMDYMREAVGAMHLSGDGKYTRQCQALLERVLGVPRVLLTTSCTDALEMSSLLLDLEPGDEVIVPSFTFVSTANAYVLRGARPVFADVRPDTLNLDESQVAARLTPRTKAIVAVHYAGVGCEMDALLALAGPRGIPVIEDNAHGLFGQYRGRNLGTLGALGTLSFHVTKNVTCGEGGALLINDRQFADRAEILRDKGTNRGRFFRGEVDKYSWVDVGSSFLPSDILAAFLFAQLEAGERIQEARRALWSRYDIELEDWARRFGIRRPVVPPHCAQAYHMYYLILPSLQARTAFITHLKAQGVHAVFHYLPLHLSDMGRRFGGREGDCPVTEDVSDRLVRLPFYNGMTPDEQTTVIDAVRAFAP